MTDSQKLDFLIEQAQENKMRFDGIEKRFVGVEEQMKGIEKRFVGVEGQMKGIEKRFVGVEGQMKGIEKRFDGVEEQMKGFEKRFDSMEASVRGIHIVFENEIRPNICRIAEGHLDLFRKLDEAIKINNETELMAIRLRMLETEVRTARADRVV